MNDTLLTKALEYLHAAEKVILTEAPELLVAMIIREWVEDHGCFPSQEEIEDEMEYFLEIYKE